MVHQFGHSHRFAGPVCQAQALVVSSPVYAFRGKWKEREASPQQRRLSGRVSLSLSVEDGAFIAKTMPKHTIVPALSYDKSPKVRFSVASDRHSLQDTDTGISSDEIARCPNGMYNPRGVNSFREFLRRHYRLARSEGHMLHLQ